MTKKVLIMTQNFYPVIGSAGNRMKNIFQLLNEGGIKTEVLTTEPAYPNKKMYEDKKFWDIKELNEGAQGVHRVPIKSKRFTNHLLSRLFFYLEIMYRFVTLVFKLRKEKYEYIYVSTPPIFIVLSAFIGKKIMKTKLILEVRDLWPDSLIGVKTFDSKIIISLFRYLEKKMYNGANYIVINSTGFQDHIKGKLKNKQLPIIYLPNGPREEELVRVNKNTEIFRVVYTGNLGLAQDIERLKQLAKSLDKEKIHFDVIGYGVKADEFQKYIESNQLENVKIYEPTTRKESLALIKKCHVAVAFLNNEDIFSTVLPGKIIDYMTCQTPVIAGVEGVSADLITSSNVGYAFEYDDLKGMVEKIIYLKNNRDTLQELGKNCKKTIKEHFLWEENIVPLIKLIIK